MNKYFISTNDVNDIKAWSGISYHMFRAMNEVDDQWTAISPVGYRKRPWFSWKKRLYARMGKQYWPNYEPTVLREQAAFVRKAAGKGPSILLSLHPDPVVCIEGDYRICIYGDATFHALHQLYPALQNLCRESVRSGHRIWQLAAKKANTAFFSSDWAKNSFVNDYGFTKERAFTVPFGANLSQEPTRETVAAAIHNRSFTSLHLIWIGVDWQRKGGSIAYRVAEALNSTGHDTKLHLVGCSFGETTAKPPWVVEYGFLDKGKSEDARLFAELLLQSHFLVFPTLADCSPVVYNEACAYGVPCIGTTVGGASTIVREGSNGVLFDPSIFLEKAISYIQEMIAQPKRYQQLALNSKEDFCTRLSWEAFQHSMRTFFAD